MHSVIVNFDPTAWAAVPANNGGSGPSWQWGDEILIGFTRGTYVNTPRGHQCHYKRPFESWLARSTDGGETWTSWKPGSYAGSPSPIDPQPGPGGVDFSASGFVLRVEGAGYHGNQAARWFWSADRGSSWKGPFEFSGLLRHSELDGKEFTARTAYLIEGPDTLLLFMTVRDPATQPGLRVTLTDKTFLARTRDGGSSFDFVSWVVPWNDPHRAAMPAPVRLSDLCLLAAIRRKSPEHNWIDCYQSTDNGQSWSHLSKVGYTEAGNKFNGNPPSLIRLTDGRLCTAYGNRTDRRIVARFSDNDGVSWGDPCTVRTGFESVNRWPDLGYTRIFQRSDNQLVVVYFWCTADQPQTHIAATIYDPDGR